MYMKTGTDIFNTHVLTRRYGYYNIYIGGYLYPLYSNLN